MRIDEGSREEHAHQSDKVEDVQRKKDNLQGSSREGIFATPALNSATGQAHLAPWRTEPEIGQERQEQLSRYLATTPDITRGIYPFKGVKLSRADVEWLLAAHENGRGPTAPSNEQQDRQGLDLRGADLRYVDLHALPLAGLRGNLTRQEWDEATEEQRAAAVILLTGADLSEAHLEEAVLIGAYLEKASLREAHLEKADLASAHLDRAFLARARLKEADLSEAHLRKADLSEAHLEGAYLNEAHLERTFLYKAHLERTFLYKAHLEGARLSRTPIEEARLRKALESGEQHIGPSLADAQWGDVNLAVVQWSQVDMLGDEYEARQTSRAGKRKNSETRFEEYEAAVRANRQLAMALRAQGLDEEAARFAYRAQLLQRIVLRRQRKFGQYLFSLLLDLLAGYGYRPGRSLMAYLVVIFSFMGLYLLNAHGAAVHLTWDEALVLSVSSFPGRGFLLQGVTLGDAFVRLAAAEAVLGLLIEVSLISTFTQRFFGK